ncbi:hypothetical protein TrST_g6582 [Triparma strigata]|uniref:Amine oxidase domain-containing protein n=1 Tax=Triparma strigata TaxID=1606541 RepID=A0A9W6ZDK3_9STRA|nr:hypothetical protein TrST_g6582 [Triparma strigata]
MSVAVIGSGIAGLSSTYHLRKYSSSTKVSLFESSERIGGHAYPFKTREGDMVDLGFMVCNHVTYPNLMEFFDRHQIPLDASSMSLGIRVKEGWEWSFGNSAALFGMMLTRRFWMFAHWKYHFDRDACAFVTKPSEADNQLTLREWCTKQGYGDELVEGWLRPICAAVWSAPHTEALGANAVAILRFLKNHGLLTAFPPVWNTPRGRTTVMLQRFADYFRANDVAVHTGDAVTSIERVGDQYTLKTKSGKKYSGFDHVVLAVPQHVVPLLAPSPDPCLQKLTSSKNDVVLHTDPSVMPRDPVHWAAWNVDSPTDTLTYWVRRLQHIPRTNLFISLNPTQEWLEANASSDTVLHRETLCHPLFTADSAATVRTIKTSLQGKNNIWYAGAWMQNGFHEDGFVSGIEAARGVLDRPDIPLLPPENDTYNPVWHTMLGSTNHVRTKPKEHKFKSSLAMDYFSLSSLPNGWIRRFRRGDYFGDPGLPLDRCVRSVVAQQCGVFPAGAVDLLTHLSAYGYCFNPISFYFCWNDSDRTRVDFLVIEVTNIPWMQRTIFTIDTRKNVRGKDVRAKPLHVSPFNPPPDGEQEWHISYDMGQLPEKFQCTVVSKRQGDTQTHASMHVRRAGDREWGLWAVLPQSVIVVLLIHVHAFFLWLKGCFVYTNATNPDVRTSLRP